MSTIFLTAVLLLTGGLVVRHIEHKRRQRFLEHFRYRLDNVTLRVYRVLLQVFNRGKRYISREVVLKVLHMVAYLVLVCIRFFERKLMALMRRMRGLGGSRTSHDRSTGGVDEKQDA